MTGRPAHSRENSASNGHRPSQPSTLRQSHTPPRRRASRDAASPTSPRNRPGSGGGVVGESTPLIQGDEAPAHPGICAHGTFSPRPSSPADGLGPPLDGLAGAEAVDSESSSGALDNAMSNVVGTDDWKRWIKRRIRTKKMDQSSELAQRAGFRFTPMM